MSYDAAALTKWMREVGSAAAGGGYAAGDGPDPFIPFDALEVILPREAALVEAARMVEAMLDQALVQHESVDALRAALEAYNNA